MRNKKITSILISVVLLSACVKSTPLDNLGILNTRGIDISEENEKQMDTTLIVYQFDEQSENVTKNIFGTGNTVKSAREDANRKSSNKLSPGQIRLELYSKEAAQKGIATYISPLVRDARVSDTMLLAVSNTTAKEVLTKGQGDTMYNVGRYLHDLIEQEYMEDSIPSVALHHFTHIIGDIGHDPVLPVISLINDTPTLTAFAVFQSDKYVGEISLDEAFLVNLFQKRVSNSPVEVSITRKPFEKFFVNPDQNKMNDEDFQVQMGVSGKSKTKIKSTEQLTYETNVDLEINIQEFSELMSVENEQVANLLEKEIAKAFEKQYESLLEKLQEINSDPFGLGNIYRINKEDGTLTEKEWREKFPEVTVDFNVNVKIMQYGTIQ
ncbi:Ger(x)C family spore germination protein [Virgibacillus ainsalahensis]